LHLSEVLGQIKVVARVFVDLGDSIGIPTTQPKRAQPFKIYVEVGDVISICAAQMIVVCGLPTG
jgi:hypothetical protein